MEAFLLIRKNILTPFIQNEFQPFLFLFYHDFLNLANIRSYDFIFSFLNHTIPFLSKVIVAYFGKTICLIYDSKHYIFT